MAEDMLMVNISNQEPTDLHVSEKKHNKSSSRQKWTAVSYCTYLTTVVPELTVSKQQHTQISLNIKNSERWSK